MLDNVIYISGPISGIENKNIEKFNEAANILRLLGYIPINPHELPETGNETWHDYMRRDIKEMMRCNGLCILPGWESSRGARLEILIANLMDIPIYRLSKYDNSYALDIEHVIVDVDLIPLIPSYLW